MHEHDGIARHLASLDEASLPPGLWARIDRQRAARVRRRRVALAAVGAVAVVAFALPALRVELGGMPTHATADAVAPVSPLRSIDRELQLAYDRGAPDEEIAELWALRRAAAADADPSSRPARI